MVGRVTYGIHHRRYTAALFAVPDRCIDPQLNTFNRKIRLFFDAVQDKDNMLYFPEAMSAKSRHS